MRQTGTPRQPEELSKLRRLADLLDQAAIAIESYLSLGEGPQDTVPLDMVALDTASDYLTKSGLGPDAQQLQRLRRLFMESLTVITGINAHRNGVMSAQEFYRKAGFTDELSNCDTPEQREDEQQIRWGLLHTTASDLQPLLRNLYAHVVRELNEHGINLPDQNQRPESTGQESKKKPSEIKDDGRLMEPIADGLRSDRPWSEYATPVHTSPLAIDLKELLRRALESKISRAVLVLQRAASLAMKEPEVNLTDSDRALLESFIDGDRNDTPMTIGFGRSLSIKFQDKQLDRLIPHYHRHEAEGQIRSEEAIRLGTHSGKPTAWELTLDLVSVAVTNRQVGYSNPKIYHELIEVYCWSLTQRERSTWDEGEEHINALQREGFTRELLEELWKICPGEAAEMKLPRPVGGKTTSPGGGNGSGTTVAATGAEQWLPATKATELANRLTGVNRDWSSFWRGFCEKHHVMSRPGTTKQGSPTEWRREVEVGSLFRAIQQHADEFEKATPEVEKRRAAIMERLRVEHGIDAELREKLLEAD